MPPRTHIDKAQRTHINKAQRTLICGIDEAGRGPLAGPVCAAAVILSPLNPDGGTGFDFSMLNDSKKLSSTQREAARSLICTHAVAWGIGWASHEEIDCINILQASLLAMKRAFEQMLECDALKTGQAFSIEAVVDGLYTPGISCPCTALVKADAAVREVMAASILAKTARDKEMERYAKLYPEYGYEKHKGYPTKAHREAILAYGPSPIQRASFRVMGT